MELAEQRGSATAAEGHCWAEALPGTESRGVGLARGTREVCIQTLGTAPCRG